MNILRFTVYYYYGHVQFVTFLTCINRCHLHKMMHWCSVNTYIWYRVPNFPEPFRLLFQPIISQTPFTTVTKLLYHYNFSKCLENRIDGANTSCKEEVFFLHINNIFPSTTLLISRIFIINIWIRKDRMDFWMKNTLVLNLLKRYEKRENFTKLISIFI